MNGDTNAATVKHLQQQPTVRWSAPSANAQIKPIQSACGRKHFLSLVFVKPLCPVLHPPEQKWDQKNWIEVSGGPLRWLGLEHLPSGARLRELGLLSLEGRWRPTSSLARPLGDCREDGARLFSEVHSEGMRGSRHKFHQGKFWQDGRKTISLWAWLSNGRGCPENMSDLHRYSQN